MMSSDDAVDTGPSSEPQLAVVTGAGTGIGRAVARQLSDSGIEVILVGRRPQMLAETASQCRSPVRMVVGNVADETCCSQIREALTDRPLSFLVQLAGVQQFGSLESISRSRWEESFATNIHARLYLVQTLLPSLMAGARLLFVGSRSAVNPRVGAAAYCCSYAASEMLVSCLRAELSTRQMYILSFLPGSVDTPLLQRSMEISREIFPDGAIYEEERKRGELIAPRAVARFVHWLLVGAAASVYDEARIAINDNRFPVDWGA